MNNICKLAYSLVCVGLVLVVVAAFLQGLGIAPLCDVFGYTGLTIWCIEVLVFACWSAVEVWKR